MVKSRTERALGYARVSTRHHAARAISLDDQGERLTAYYRQRGVELVDLYGDAGLSGGTDDRPALMAMFEHALRPGGDIAEIGVCGFSRLFRDLSLLEHYRCKLERAGVRLVAISEGPGPAYKGSRTTRASMRATTRDAVVAEDAASAFGIPQPSSDEAA